MKKLRYTTRMMFVLLGIVIISMSIAAMSSLLMLRSANMKIHTTVLENASKFISYIDIENLTNIPKTEISDTDMRLTIIKRDGTVIFDSHYDPAKMENHASRPEIAAALSGLEYNSVRFSETLQTYMLYHAFPVKNYIVRLAIPVSEISSLLKPYMQLGVIILCLLVAAVSAVLFFYNSSVIQPINALMYASKAWENGNLSYRIHIKATDDFAESIHSLNTMSEKLESTLKALNNETKELGAILENINEAILVTDSTLHITLANPAACRLFNQPFQNYPQNLIDFTASLDIHKAALDCFESQTPAEQEITLYGVIKLKLLVRCSPLNADNTGIILAITDITKIRYLEDMRKDFVANVSHELRTPITLIKGYAEALLEDSILNNKDVAAKIAIIHRHADRMNAIIEDLLMLSRLDASSHRAINMETVAVCALIDDARSSISTERTIIVSCPQELTLTCNPELMEQALINLIDNAIKYTSGTITIEAHEQNSFIIINVIDEGPGIPEEHAQRIFERFYRIDKARSRETGGTGLGLSIVKHIVTIHRGSVSVRNNTGKGAIFTICIPTQPASS